MKKLLFLAAIFIGIGTVQSQVRVTQKDSLVNVDTSYLNFNGISGHVKSLQVTALKSSGTVSGKIYIEGTVDGLAWVKLDSLVLADVATYQTKAKEVTNTSYNSYRSECITTGTQKFYNWFSVLRRPDE